MATVEEVVRDFLGSMASGAGAPIAAKWLDSRYQEIVSRVRFKHLRKIGELSIPAKEDDGTVTVTRGSTSVTGASTTWVTDIGSGTQTQYYIKCASAWYKISSIGGETSITLASAFAEDDVSAGSYAIVKRYHSLSSNARWLGDFILTRLRKRLSSASTEEMDYLFSGRWLTGNIPSVVSEFNVDSNNAIQVEIYPYPSESEIIHYVYWDLPSTLSFTSTIPKQIDPHILKEGMKMDFYGYKQAMEADKGNFEGAAFWRNEKRAQETRWDKVIGEAKRADGGMDDASFILSHFSHLAGRSGEQRTARDIVIDRSTWPSYI